MRTILLLAGLLAAANPARAGDWIFETRLAKLVISPEGKAVSLSTRGAGRELLNRRDFPFAAMRKGGRLFPVTALSRRGGLYTAQFGTSGAEADYRITALPDYFVVELAGFRGDGIEEIRLFELNVSPRNGGGPLGVRWDQEFAICLMGLSPGVHSRAEGQNEVASLYPALGMRGERVALLASPTNRFAAMVRQAELEFHLPSPTIGGVWAKSSNASRSSYLFTDLTEANAGETLRYARAGGFRYILVYNSTWAVSPGSYAIHPGSFPHGEAGLKAVVDRCHAVGIKVGMHMMTSFVGKNDPLVQPTPTPWLLKDVETTLTSEVGQADTEIPTVGLPGHPDGVFSYGPAHDLQIEDEIIHYEGIRQGNFVRCTRGYAGTHSSRHEAGAKVSHLVEYAGAYVADLSTPLRDAISERVAGLINRCGFDMIYFDGGEINNTGDPGWYRLGQQQSQIVRMVKRDLLVQGSGISNWTWHIFTRGTSDDTSALAVKEYLDYHKVADYWRGYQSDFLPAELGWAGIFSWAPDHAATTPDEVEHYATRMLAFDSGVSFETNLAALKANGRTGEMLEMLGRYQSLRARGTVPLSLRHQLEQGEWHMDRQGVLHPVRYDTRRITVPAEVRVENRFNDQSLEFRLEAKSDLTELGANGNIPLLRASLEVAPPARSNFLTGALAWRIAVSGDGKRKGNSGNPLDLTDHRVLAAEVEVEGGGPEGEAPVLNIQLESSSGVLRDHFVDLNFRGTRKLLLTEPGAQRILTEFRPDPSAYEFKSALMGGFDYGSIVAVNLRWMRYPPGSARRCKLTVLEALEERNRPLAGVVIAVGETPITVPVSLEPGDYAEYRDDGPLRVFNRDGMLRASVPFRQGPLLKEGGNRLVVSSQRAGNAVLTVITTGR